MLSLLWGLVAAWLFVGALSLFQAQVKADAACPQWKICVAGLLFAAIWPVRAVRHAVRLLA
jgi:hypothetical protein